MLVLQIKLSPRASVLSSDNFWGLENIIFYWNTLTDLFQPVCLRRFLTQVFPSLNSKRLGHPNFRNIPLREIRMNIPLEDWHFILPSLKQFSFLGWLEWQIWIDVGHLPVSFLPLCGSIPTAGCRALLPSYLLAPNGLCLPLPTNFQQRYVHEGRHGDGFMLTLV